MNGGLSGGRATLQGSSSQPTWLSAEGSACQCITEVRFPHWLFSPMRLPALPRGSPGAWRLAHCCLAGSATRSRKTMAEVTHLAASSHSTVCSEQGLCPPVPGHTQGRSEDTRWGPPGPGIPGWPGNCNCHIVPLTFRWHSFELHPCLLGLGEDLAPQVDPGHFTAT